jgi:hypothetical protein
MVVTVEGGTWREAVASGDLQLSCLPGQALQSSKPPENTISRGFIQGFDEEGFRRGRIHQPKAPGISGNNKGQCMCAAGIA